MKGVIETRGKCLRGNWGKFYKNNEWENTEEKLTGCF